MGSELCDALRVDISARLDGELEADRARALDRHLEGCPACRGFERRLRATRTALRVQSAEPVPNLTDSIMRRVRAERPLVLRRREMRAGLRIAAVAAVVAALVVVTASVPFVRRQPQTAAASEIVKEVRAAAEELQSYTATFAITEWGFTDEVGKRRFRAEVAFEAPERFRLRIRDLSTYPDPRWPLNEVNLVAQPDRWWIEEPQTCPVEVLLACDLRQGTTERTVVERQPFDGTSTLPTDIIVPLETLAGSGNFEVLGRDRIAGRDAVEVALSYREALPLVTALQPGGMWRSFHPLDRVQVWLDERTWFPLRFLVRAHASTERAEWARLEGHDDEPGARLLDVRARRFSQRPVARGVFDVPHDGTIRTGDFVRVPARPSWQSPRFTDGLPPYRVGRTPEGRWVMSYAKGMTWLKVTGGPRDRGDPALLASAEEIELSSSGLGYYRPGTETFKRRVDVFGENSHLQLESNLPRAKLERVASSLPVEGRSLPRDIGRSGRSSVSRLDVAAASNVWYVKEPTYLPEGYRATAAVRSSSADDGETIVIYLRRSEVEFEGDGIRITQSPSVGSLAPSGETSEPSELDGVDARWFPERGELEWIDDDDVYRSITVPSGDLPTALDIAGGLR